MQSTANTTDSPPPGARIAAWRTERGLIQDGLAQRAHVSTSLLRKVERGEREPTAAFLAAVARALHVDQELLAHGRLHERLEDMLPPIAAALDLFDLPPDETITPRPLGELSTAVRRVNRLAQAADYEPMATMLPGLLAELHTAAHTLTGEDAERAWALLAEASRCGHSVGIALGHNELSVQALGRVDWAATQAGPLGPGWRTAREYLRVTAYMRSRDFDTCWRLNQSGLAHLCGTDDTPGATVARGQLHLGAAMISGHTGDHDARQDHLDAAEHLAHTTGEQPERFWFGFGPTNVASHRVVTAVVAGEYGEAVQAAEGLEFPTWWLPTRTGHTYLHLAKAWRWLNRPEKALDALYRARAAAPGQAQHHPLARDTVTGLLSAEGRRSEALSAYATWLGL